MKCDSSNLKKLRLYSIYLSQRRIGLKSAGAELLFVLLSLYFQDFYFEYNLTCIMRKSIEYKLCAYLRFLAASLESVGKVLFSNISCQDASDFSPQTQRKKDIVIPYIMKNYEFFFLLLCVLCASAPLREPLFRGFSTDSCASTLGS